MYIIPDKSIRKNRPQNEFEFNAQLAFTIDFPGLNKAKDPRN